MADEGRGVPPAGPGEIAVLGLLPTGRLRISSGCDFNLSTQLLPLWRYPTRAFSSVKSRDNNRSESAG